MEKFFKKLASIYTVDEIQWNLAALLGDKSRFSNEVERQEAVEAGYNFLKEIYELTQE